MANKKMNLKNLVTYLLTPEDTSSALIGGRYQVEIIVAEKWYGRLKASLWIVVPIALSVLILAV